MILPELDVNTFVKHFRLTPEKWLAAVVEVCHLHRIPFAVIAPFTDGSNLIAALDHEYVVKIFPPFHRHQWESEYRVLEHLDGKLSFPIPRLIAYGERPDQWTYVIVTLLAGLALENCWNDFSSKQQEAILFQTGQMMAEVHALPVGNLATLPPLWPDFYTRQLTTFHHRHRVQGMPEWFVELCSAYVHHALPLIPAHPKMVLLTGEYTPFNMLVDANSKRPFITGMIDFGDAMTGYHEYDLTGPLMFLAAGKASHIQSLLSGYGYTSNDMNVDLRSRLMVLQILHRYSDFDSQLKMEGWRARANSIESLAALIWPLEK